MSEENEHIEALRKIKNILVESRRRAAQDSDIDGVVGAQKLIDVVQLAIEDEEGLVSPKRGGGQKPTAAF